MTKEMKIASERLMISPLTQDDAAFVLELVNDPDFIRYIGDREVRTLDEAKYYIENGPWSHYKEPGFGQLKVAELHSGQAVGLCGLLKRDYLEKPDIGFAFLPSFRSQGYALEAAQAVIKLASDATPIGILAGIVSPDNVKSIRLLERLGMKFVRELRADEVSSPALLYQGRVNEGDH